jgi:hypothetical protein
VLVLRRLINDHRNTAHPIIPNEYLEKEYQLDNWELQRQVEATEGVTLIWRNRDSERNGCPRKESNYVEQPEEWKANIEDEFEIQVISDIREFARESFNFRELGVKLARFYTLKTDPANQHPVKEELIQERWDAFRNRVKGTRRRIFVVVDTVRDNNDEWKYIPEAEDADISPLGMYPLVQDDDVPDIDLNFQYRLKTLDFDGQYCKEYAYMKDKKPHDAETANFNDTIQIITRLYHLPIQNNSPAQKHKILVAHIGSP